METTCQRCKRTFHRLFDEMRFWSGEFVDPETGESYTQLCDDCHREVVRN